jgi:hypothetical protein
MADRLSLNLKSEVKLFLQLEIPPGLAVVREVAFTFVFEA